MSTEAFGETLQFITNVKLEELEKRRQKYADHAVKVSAEASAHGDTNLIARLEVLIDGLKTWPGAWSANLNVGDVKRWLEQAKRDPGFPSPVLQEWIKQAEAEMDHEKTRYDFARLFGNLLTDWLESSKAPAKRVASPDEFEKVNRKDTLEQKEKLETLIFEEKQVDIPALEAYLNDLFSSKDAKDALKVMRERMKKFSEGLRKTAMTTDEVKTVISSALRSDVLSEEKQATLKEFKRNPSVLQELASVLNMQREAIQSWHWPQSGVLLEPRRHLNGKTRFYLDTEILTCLLLHYLGLRWAVEFRQAFDVLRQSPAWKKPAHTLTRTDHRRRGAFIPSLAGRVASANTLDGIRQGYRRDHFFMCQLPEDLEDTIDNYGENDSDDVGPSATSGPVFDTPVNLKQSLLHIITADLVLNKTLYGQGTVVRTDLEWFGPSLPHQTIQTVLRFFGMPEEDLKFMLSFLSCPIVFKDDPSGLVRTRKRGVPISYMLSTLCGEASLFVMDFAVNQRANGLFLYRIHDDFWFWDKAPESCATAWKEMNTYAALAGLTFNQEKTGSVCVGAKLHPDLPEGDVRWGFLKMDGDGRFVIDQAMIDEHTVELRRQLDATTSIFGWTQAYNKYMAFVVRNCGEPAFVYGKAHIDGIIDTLARIQRALFPEESGGTGGFIITLAKMLESKFGVHTSDIPLGFYLWPNAAGGLGVKDPLVDLFLVRDSCKETAEDIINKTIRQDEVQYAKDKETWDNGEADRLVKTTGIVKIRRLGEESEVSPSDPFMTFEEYIKGREESMARWGDAYLQLLRRPGPVQVTCTPELGASITNLGSGLAAFGVRRSGGGWPGLSKYWQWVIGVHHHEMIKKFGSLAIVDPNAVPVGMVSVFKSSRMKWEQ